jgi:hypothetical protein
MTRDDAPGPWQIAHALLTASQLRIESHQTPSLLLTASTALGNLLFCVLFENSIKEDPGSGTLSVFFFIQGFMIFLLTLTHLASTGGELLRKTLVMPVTPAAHLAYAVLSSARHPLMQALVLSDLFFLLVLYHQSAIAMIMVPVLGCLMAADVIALTSLGSVAAIRKARPPTILAAYCILGVVALVASSLLLHMPTALGALPPVWWTTRGILAAAAGNVGTATMCGAASIALLIVTGILGRRVL